jgi:hypothetical protein
MYFRIGWIDLACKGRSGEREEMPNARMQSSLFNDFTFMQLTAMFENIASFLLTI